MEQTVINPKKAVKYYFDEHKVGYRLEDLKKTIYVFIKQCGSAYEEVRLGRKNEVVVELEYRSRIHEILEEYFKNGNGERKSMKEFLDQVVDQKGRLYAQ